MKNEEIFKKLTVTKITITSFDRKGMGRVYAGEKESKAFTCNVNHCNPPRTLD